MSSYENAPATKLLATHCCICRHPLLDAKSVEAGIGPDCREKHGYNIDVSEEARLEANKLVHQAACEQDESYVVLCIADQLRELGFAKLANTLIDRTADIRVGRDGSGVLSIQTPYNNAATSDWRRIPGRYWDKEAKRNIIPDTEESRRAFWNLCKTWFPGAAGYSADKGPFTVPGEPS